MCLGHVLGFDVSHDGSVVVGGSEQVVIAHITATGAVLWRKEMHSRVWTLRIHGGVVVVPLDDNDTVVLDVTTGHQLHTLPSAGELVYGIVVVDGLKNDWVVVFSLCVIILAPLTKMALTMDDNVASSGSNI